MTLSDAIGRTDFEQHRCRLPPLWPQVTETGEPMAVMCWRPAVGDNPLSSVTQYVCDEHLRRVAVLLFMAPAMAVFDWEWVDDPTDACSYCVRWVDGQVLYGVEAVPYHADGSIARRVTTTPHPACLQSVANYVAESRGGA